MSIIQTTVDQKEVRRSAINRQGRLRRTRPDHQEFAWNTLLGEVGNIGDVLHVKSVLASALLKKSFPVDVAPAFAIDGGDQRRAGFQPCKEFDQIKGLAPMV